MFHVASPDLLQNKLESTGATLSVDQVVTSPKSSTTEITSPRQKVVVTIIKDLTCVKLRNPGSPKSTPETK